MRILVTGTAGFIGYHTTKELLSRGDEVVGLDNINSYYDVRLKHGRLQDCGIKTDRLHYNSLIDSDIYGNYKFITMDLEDRNNIEKLFGDSKFDMVINLAAQAGVRYSITNPYEYINSNIMGFTNILECSRHNRVKHLVYASSSSVYGLNKSQPFSTGDNVDHPISLYAASKKSNELMAHCYSHLYSIPTTGLRFFTVYGPWGRPDMAIFIFTKAILENKPISIFNNGHMERDFTYIDDIVQGIIKVLDSPPAGNSEWSGAEPDPASSSAPYKIYNIGNSSPVQLMAMISIIEDKLGKKAEKIMLPMQPGDVPSTFADVSDLINDMNYKPATDIKDGISRFIDWYLSFYSKTV